MGSYRDDLEAMKSQGVPQPHHVSCQGMGVVEGCRGCERALLGERDRLLRFVGKLQSLVEVTAGIDGPPNFVYQSLWDDSEST